jgi:hypothetical protein
MKDVLEAALFSERLLKLPSKDIFARCPIAGQAYRNPVTQHQSTTVAMAMGLGGSSIAWQHHNDAGLA